MKELDKVYQPKDVEPKIYEMWETGGYFKPEVHPDGKPFTIMMPPPNITGQLHLGHAFDGTLQDILTRYKRMQGYSALWLPGEDHASIATEVKVVNKLYEEEGKTKQEIGREAFLKRAWEWSDFYRARIAKQFRKLGASCDWSRERFTMDEGCSEAVKEAFVRMYDDGLIYRANRIINWCPDCKTALSDAEVEYEEQGGHLWYIKYPIKDSSEFVTVATTRPETMLGDTAVAVNPNDERYQHLIGKTAILPLMNREIPIIADDYVDAEFGTGCVKITPCHDPNDFEVGQRHNLEQIRVLDDDAIINAEGGIYEGLERYEARKKIIRDLEELNLLDKIEDIKHNVGTCYRCKTVVEPITSLQWFVEMKPLAEPAIKAVKEEEIRFVPDRFKKIYFNWMENIRDWCISRQLWWGHRIPAYYCDSCGEVVVAKEMPDVCPHCGGTSFHQDEDVLDTWFSSALWPFSTLGWPEQTADFKKYYPNDVLVTGFDIIFFWVARMIFSGLYQAGNIPFHHVYIHGLIRDEQGRKMSKSLGNGVDPLDVIEEYGADALRYTIVTGNAAGNDTRWHESKVQASRNFANKINNAARFIMMNMEGFDPNSTIDRSDLNNLDKWILSRTNDMIEEVTANLDKYELGIALEKLYQFIWTEFCDWYIEFVKPRLYGDDATAKHTAQWTLYHVFIDLLKLLHPFMPFITEEIYGHISDDEQPLIVASWPVPDAQNRYDAEQNEVNEIIDGIRGIRNARAEMNIPPSKKASVYICTSEENAQMYRGNENIFAQLASASDVVIASPDTEIENALSVVTNTAKFFVPLDDLIDKGKELQRLQKEQEKAQSEIARLSGKLSNPNFVEKAPEKIVNGEKEKLAQYEALLAEIKESIAKL
jgi:valyl-tRNA synthetase